MQSTRGDEFHGGELVGGVLRVEALLGQGGAAAVYRVRDERTGRKLALKQLLPPSDERRALVSSLFEREYHTLSQLAHPRIIEVHDYGFERGCAYYTMELLDGEDLHERGKLPWRRACALLCDVASSLAIVHSRGMVHRDVSARNVRCTGDGRAKLIDFGAMAPVGASHRLVGTPPFVPPEALQLQALDGRADLYGLGALAYWTLTGRHAYAAHTFNQLRDLWRNPPRDPRLFEPELPEALCALVLALLSLDRAERPRSAAQAMEQLCGIAGLPLHELPQVGRAYLIMPTLIARDAALRDARSALLQALQNSAGGGVLIEGPDGSGRSRMLEACVLEAKLLGATLLRTRGGDVEPGDYACARELGGQLLQALPQLAHQSAQPRLALLARVLPQLSVEAQPHGVEVVERRHLQAALRDWILTVARSKPIVIAVDDLERIDEPTAALLGALCHGASRRRLMLLLTARAATDDSPALALLRESSRRVVLANLDAEQTRTLLCSLFGDTERLVPLAERIHQLSQGNPRHVMWIVDHLCERGAVRYEAGSWALPLQLAADDFPRRDRESLAQCMAALPPAARRLAEALSLTDTGALSLADYIALGDPDDTGHRFAGLDALVAAGVLIADGERYRLSQPDALAAVAAALPKERRFELHARLARLLEGSAPPAIVQQHMLRGGREQEAIAQLLAAPAEQVERGSIDVLQCAVEVAEERALPLRTTLELQQRLLRGSAVAGRIDVFERYGRPMIERLERDSGVLDWLEQTEATSPGERLARALASARSRHETQGQERSLPPHESLLLLAAVYRSFASMAAVRRDVQLVEQLHSLEPFRALAPFIGFAQDAIDIARALQTGRYLTMESRCEALLRELDAPGVKRLDNVGQMRLAYAFLLGIVTASRGGPSFARWIDELEQTPGHRGNAWRVRMLYELACGEVERARECRRRAELLDLQDSGVQAFPGTTVGNELRGYASNGDVLGVKRVLDQLEALARAHPGWQPALTIGRALYKALQGDPQGALDALAPAEARLEPLRHLDWALARNTRLSLLLQLRRDGEAAQLGVETLELCTRLAFREGADWLEALVAAALIKTGSLSQARELLDQTVARLVATGYGSAPIAALHELRTRAAMLAGDEAGAHDCLRALLDASTDAQGNIRKPARYRQLQRDVAARFSQSVPDAALAPASAPPPGDAARTVYSRMLTCISPAERATAGLQLLLDATGAQLGYLFGLRSGGLRCLSSSGETAPDDMLTRMLDDYLRRALEAEAGSSTTSRRQSSPGFEAFIDDLGREFEPLLLAGRHHGEDMIAGVAALHFGDEDRPEPRRAMLDAVIEALISEDVVDPITCVA